MPCPYSPTYRSGASGVDPSPVPGPAAGGGLLIISTHGDATRDRLVRTEAQAYDRGDLVVGDRVLKDSRTFLAYQSPQFVRRTLLREFEVLGHDQSPASILYPQDLWVTRKPAPGAANSRS